MDMNNETRQHVKRRRIDVADDDTSNRNHEDDCLGVTDQLTIGSNIYPIINVTGNARAILGNVLGMNNEFFHCASSTESSKMLLNALYFEGMRSRKEQIDARAGSPSHVEWIWTTNFPTWLGSCGSFYWITGRAGSGKSTLMKHICESRRTLGILQRDGQTWTKLHFFFDFRAGSSMANNIEGMLRSLLYQLVKRLPEVAHNIDHTLYKDNLRSNSLSSCMDNLCEVLNTTSTKVCAFIDGLDEIQDCSAQLLGTIHSLEDRTGIKICLASRPYPIFESDLSRFPHLAVQDYNDESIRLYTESQWNSSRISIEACLPRTLSNKVREKARGVFLWARLATDKLLRDFLAGKSIEELERQLELMPRDVQEMYQRILDHLPPILKSEAAILLYMIINGEREVAVGKLYAALEAVNRKLDRRSALLPIQVDVNNEYWISGVLGDFLDIISTSQLADRYRNQQPEAQISFENSMLRCYRQYNECVSLTHETLRSFLTMTNWLGENLPSNLKVENGSRFWLDIYKEEIVTCARECDDRSSEIYAHVKAYVQKVEKDIDIYESTQPSTHEEDLMKLLDLWPQWTPLLPFALQEAFKEIWRYRFSQEVDFSELQQIMLSPCFALHSAICMFQTFDSFVRSEGEWRDAMMMKDGSYCAFCKLQSEQELNSAVEIIGWDIALAVCHELPGYIYHRVVQGFPRLKNEKQYLFDLVWEKFLETGMFSDFEPLLHLLVTAGCRLEGRHLCAFLEIKYHDHLTTEFVCTFISCHLVKQELDHATHCPYSCAYSSKCSYLYHWVGCRIMWEPRKTKRRALAVLLKALLTSGQHVNHICRTKNETILNIILDCASEPEREIWCRMTKFILILKAGADPYLVGQSGTAFDAANKLLESYLKLSPGKESNIVQAQKIIEVLEFYANHHKTLPPNLDDYFEFDRF